MARLVWIVAVLVCSVVGAEEPEQWLKDFVEKSKAKAQADLKQNREDLTLAKKGKVVRGSRGKTEKVFVFENVGEKKQMVSKLEFAIKENEEFLDGKFGPLTDDELLVGVGGLPYYPIGVIQVASDNGAVVDIGYSPPYGRAFKQDPQRHVWLEHSTDGWLDGSRVDLKLPVVVIGTKRYGTVEGGSRTIPMLRVLTSTDVEHFRKLMKQSP